MSGLIKSAIEGLGQDYLTDKANEYAEEHFQPTKNPYYETIKLPNGEIKEIRRKLPKDLFSKKESKAWKSVQNKAWSHDRSMCGCCCWTDTIGWAPLLALIPVIGPALMYSIHNKLITYADKEFHLPVEVKAKMHGNIMVDLCISLVPILGTLFSWLHTCSTRNAAIVYNFVVKRAVERRQTNFQRQQLQSQGPPQVNNGSSYNNLRNTDNRNQKENQYEMRNLNSRNNFNDIRAPQQAKYRQPQQQQRYNNPPASNQRQQRYTHTPPPPGQQRYTPPSRGYQTTETYNKSNNGYYEPKKPNLPYPTEDTEFY